MLLVLGALDWHFIQVAYQATLTQGASVQLVFGFEYAILLTMVAMVTVKYALHTYDINRENPWEDKAVFLLYAELAIGTKFIKIFKRLKELNSRFHSSIQVSSKLFFT